MGGVQRCSGVSLGEYRAAIEAVDREFLNMESSMDRLSILVDRYNIESEYLEELERCELIDVGKPFCKIWTRTVMEDPGYEKRAWKKSEEKRCICGEPVQEKANFYEVKYAWSDTGTLCTPTTVAHEARDNYQILVYPYNFQGEMVLYHGWQKFM